MDRYGRDYPRREPDRGTGWTGGGRYAGPGYRQEGYRVGRWQRGLDIGPTLGGSDIGYSAFRSRGDLGRGYDRGFRGRRVFRAGGGYDRGWS